MSSTPYFFVFIIISHFLNFTSYYLLLFFYFFIYFFFFAFDFVVCVLFHWPVHCNPPSRYRWATSRRLDASSCHMQMSSFAYWPAWIASRLRSNWGGLILAILGRVIINRDWKSPPLLCGNSVSVCKLATFICIFPSQYFNFNQCSLQRNSSTSNRIRLI